LSINVRIPNREIVLDITFSITGVEDRETIPTSVIEGIQEAVAWARRNVKAKDLVEMDPKEREE